MTTVLNSRGDITLDAVLAVAWRGGDIRLGEAAVARIAAARESFETYVARVPGASVYGVNQGQGEMIAHILSDEDRLRLVRLKPYAAAVPFGDPYPARVVRAMIVARFANLLDGHAAATPRLCHALARLLNDGPLPAVAQQGQGGPGEILALYPLFAALSQGLDLEPGERGALINGAPAAAALLADAVLVAERRQTIAERVMALAIVAFNAPVEHYDIVLAELHGGGYQLEAFGRLGALLDGMADGIAPRHYQAPVSYRIVPHVLSQARWAINTARELAAEGLSAVTHNPIYLTPDEHHPLGRCLSTGGYHNAVAAPAMDAIAGSWADLCLLCLRLCVGLLNGRVSGYPDFLLSGRLAGESDGHGAVGYLPMAIVGYMEEARSVATRTFIPAADASVFGQDDVAAPAFLAWPKTIRAGECLDACLAILAVAASQALHATGRRTVPPALEELIADVRRRVPPVEADRVLGPELQSLAGALTAEVFAEDLAARGAVAP